jgi:hypothetical protein
LWLARTLVAVLAAAASTPALAQEFRTVTLMSWNVENLFDTIDDLGNPFDDTFLPKAVKTSVQGMRHTAGPSTPSRPLPASASRSTGRRRSSAASLRRSPA